jgi:hypothetical protein
VLPSSVLFTTDPLPLRLSFVLSVWFFHKFFLRILQITTWNHFLHLNLTFALNFYFCLKFFLRLFLNPRSLYLSLFLWRPFIFWSLLSGLTCLRLFLPKWFIDKFPPSAVADVSTPTTIYRRISATVSTCSTIYGKTVHIS